MKPEQRQRAMRRISDIVGPEVVKQFMMNYEPSVEMIDNDSHSHELPQLLNVSRPRDEQKLQTRHETGQLDGRPRATSDAGVTQSRDQQHSRGFNADDSGQPGQQQQ